MRFWKWLGGLVCRWHSHEWRQVWRRRSRDALLSGTVTRYRCRRCGETRNDWTPGIGADR